MSATRNGSAAAASDTVEQIVDRLRRIPLQARRFWVSSDRAHAAYRIDGELLSSAIGAGLPHVPGPDGPLFDADDLTNLSLRLRLRSPMRAAMRYWDRILNRPAGDRREFLVDYLARCPLPGHGGDCEMTCGTPDGVVAVPWSAAEFDRPLVTTAVTLHNDWPDLPPGLVELIGELADVEFYRLPRLMKADIGFMLEQRIGDCLGFARFLTDRGNRRGLRMRCVFGLIVSPPYSAQHFWAEVDVAGRWVPVDPGLLRGLAVWGVLDPGWPEHRSPGAILAGLSDRNGIVVSDHGVPVPPQVVAFRTRVTAATAE
ncbi:transglutaminase domain-containing protein [Dactylosporangium sp. NPDC051485]|uniref:transglutaminase domain-containing protein n=1 Tax=Dactylosporangium sp. NPDC051485 TaxID=3154846 RepID=UPI00342C98B3